MFWAFQAERLLPWQVDAGQVWCVYEQRPCHRPGVQPDRTNPSVAGALHLCTFKMKDVLACTDCRMKLSTRGACHESVACGNPARANSLTVGQRKTSPGFSHRFLQDRRLIKGTQCVST